ncbi:hypothetical protein ABGB18_23200 [Nonomuraea sp. B12E4]|uniref:hypothetical protein n=1 Tax=Nonomuraea sp. B12E4 TaxID=3153564 RepID=UPI00325C729C
MLLGYGAMVSAMLAPDVFGALATHAGDALFEVSNRGSFPVPARRLCGGGGWPAIPS